MRGGGFDYAMIDTDDPSVRLPYGEPTPTGTIVPVAIAVTTPEPVTSNHSTDGSSQTLWGNGAVGTTGVGGTTELKCTSCHDPHGNGNYRILRTEPSGSGGGGVAIPDTYGSDYDTTNYLDMTFSGDDHAPSILQDTSAWCAECHTRYLATRRDPDPAGRSREDSGDPDYAFRHTSSGVSYNSSGDIGYRNRACITCHASHGTNAVTDDGGASEGVGLPGGTPAPASEENSRLLKMDNRGICQKCHNK